jgi:hypothetical protein
VYRNVRCFPSLTELATELNEHPTLSTKCGFDPIKPIPSVERFSPFLHDTPNQTLQTIRTHLVKQLALTGEITFKYLSADSCPTQANVGESPLLIPHLKEIVSTYSSNPDDQIEAFIGDAAYDSIPNFNFIAKELKAKPIIAPGRDA